MSYSITAFADKDTSEMFEKSFKEFEDFFEMKWTKNRPQLFVVEDLGYKYAKWGKDAPNWLKGWSNGNGVFVLTRKLIKKEEGLDFDKKRWFALIRHELVHRFFEGKTKANGSRWLNEGLCIYLSGQLKWKKKIVKFSSFLKKDGEMKSGEIYKESGRVVELLVEKYGKGKMLELLMKYQEKRPDEDGFSKLFKEVYEFELGYKEFNRLLE